MRHGCNIGWLDVKRLGTYYLMIGLDKVILRHNYGNWMDQYMWIRCDEVWYGQNYWGLIAWDKLSCWLNSLGLDDTIMWECYFMIWWDFTE